jgi:hypothetical protein
LGPSLIRAAKSAAISSTCQLDTRRRLGEVLVLWDLHPDGRVLVEDYWKFERDDVLSLDFKLLLGNLRHLPEDVYIFDRSFRWTLVLTHEHVGDKRWCLVSGQIAQGGMGPGGG